MRTAEDVDRELTHWPRRMISNGDANTVRLRGGAAFEAWRERGMPASVSPWILMGDHDPLHHFLYYVAVPADPHIAAYLEQLAKCRHCVVVVDVFFPITRPDAVVGAAETVAYWLQHRETGLRAIRVANVVTTPWPACDGCPDWIDMLSDVNPNVMILPDLVDGPLQVASFQSILESAWQLGLTLK